MKECYGGKQKSENNILKMFFGFSMASWVSAGIGFLLTPIITRTIYPAELGQIDMFVTYCNMFIYASTLGMHQGYMRFFNDLPKDISDAINIFSKVKMKIGAEYETDTGGVDMCKAIEDLREEERIEGISIGLQKGKEVLPRPGGRYRLVRVPLRYGAL